MRTAPLVLALVLLAGCGGVDAAEQMFESTEQELQRTCTEIVPPFPYTCLFKPVPHCVGAGCTDGVCVVSCGATSMCGFTYPNCPPECPCDAPDGGATSGP